MLRTDKPIYKVILILNLLFIVAGIVFSIIGFTNANMNTTRIISNIADIACLVFAAFYIFGGYTKSAAKYYKMFGVFLAVRFFISVLSGSVNSKPTLSIMVATFSLVLILVLLLSENLGKTKSFVLCGLLVIIQLVLLIVGKDKSVGFIISNLVRQDLACLYGIMTYAKYLDKAERGTK